MCPSMRKAYQSQTCLPLLDLNKVQDLCRSYRAEARVDYKTQALDSAGPVEVPGIINDSEAETASGHDSVRTIRRNTPLENNKCSHSTSTRSFLSNEKTERTTFRTNNHTEPAHVTVQEKRRQLPSGHTNYSDQVQDDAVQTERRKQPESSKCIESVRTKIIRSLLACFLRNKSKKRRQETVGNSQLSTLEEMDERSKVQDLTREPSKLIEEDITLACWCKQLKKRVATVAACPDESNKRVGSKYI
ncbi:hypothetical protein V6N13_041985 [Hibiscus sabdariffa]